MSAKSLPNVTALSQRARLAVALHLFRRYCDCRRLAHEEIDQFLDHLWAFVGLRGDPAAFEKWRHAEPPLTEAGLGGSYPVGFDRVLESAGVPEEEFRRALGSCTEVLYISMFGAADEEQSRRYLYELAEIAGALGVRWPNLDRF